MKKITLLIPLLVGLVACGVLAPRTEQTPGLMEQPQYVESCAEVLTPEEKIHVPVAWCDDNATSLRYQIFWVLQGTVLPPYGQPLGSGKDWIKTKPSKFKITRHTAPAATPQAVVPVPVQQSTVATSVKPKSTSTKTPGQRTRW